MLSTFLGAPVDVRILIGLGCAAVASAGGVFMWKRRKPLSLEEREKLRRLDVCRTGRVVEGVVIDVRGDTIDYIYSARGIEYHAQQDLSSIRGLLPEGDQWLLGQVSVKYMTENPANSIVVGEEWSGLRQPAAAAKQAS